MAISGPRRRERPYESGRDPALVRLLWAGSDSLAGRRWDEKGVVHCFKGKAWRDVEDCVVSSRFSLFNSQFTISENFSFIIQGGQLKTF